MSGDETKKVICQGCDHLWNGIFETHMVSIPVSEPRCFCLDLADKTNDSVYGVVYAKSANYDFNCKFKTVTLKPESVKKKPWWMFWCSDG